MMRKRTMIMAVAAFLAQSGCDNVNSMFTPGGESRVEMSMAVSGIAEQFAGPVQGGIVDSVRIDSAVIVLSRIKFEDHTNNDTLFASIFKDDDGDAFETDDGDEDEKEETDDASERNASFRGPFVVLVRDTIEVDLGSANLPPGRYTTVKMKIHRLLPWHHHRTIDREERHDAGPKPYLSSTGSSVMAWGAMSKDGVWHPFTFAFNGEFRVVRKVSISVSENARVIPIAFHVDARKWFIHPRTGELLDPHDISAQQIGMFKISIQRSFYDGQVCEDDEHDIAIQD